MNGTTYTHDGKTYGDITDVVKEAYKNANDPADPKVSTIVSHGIDPVTEKKYSVTLARIHPNAGV